MGIKRLQDAMSGDQIGELTRLADGLSKTRTPGTIVGDISEAINTDGLKAVAEFKVVRDRLAKIATPEQVRALDRAVMGQLPPQVRDQIEGIFNPKPVQPDINPEADRPITATPLALPNLPDRPELERDEVQTMLNGSGVVCRTPGTRCSKDTTSAIGETAGRRT